jgi:glc operon protein GlcG
MKTQSKTVLASIFAIVIATAVASAQQPSPSPTTPYGPPIGLEAAKKVMAAAEAEAIKNNWGMAVVILDSTGHMVMLHKMDNTQYGSIAVAEDKARSALYFRRPSKVFEDLVAQGGIGLRTLALRGATPLEGGIPLTVDGKIVGAIGASGIRHHPPTHTPLDACHGPRSLWPKGGSLLGRGRGKWATLIVAEGEGEASVVLPQC